MIYTSDCSWCRNDEESKTFSELLKLSRFPQVMYWFSRKHSNAILITSYIFDWFYDFLCFIRFIYSYNYTPIATRCHPRIRYWLRTVMIIDRLKQVYVKFSALFRLSRSRFPYYDITELLSQVISSYGANRVMWGR